LCRVENIPDTVQERPPWSLRVLLACASDDFLLHIRLVKEGQAIFEGTFPNRNSGRESFEKFSDLLPILRKLEIGARLSAEGRSALKESRLDGDDFVARGARAKE
jgi:hypothetical protein